MLSSSISNSGLYFAFFMGVENEGYDKIGRWWDYKSHWTSFLMGTCLIRNAVACTFFVVVEMGCGRKGRVDL